MEIINIKLMTDNAKDYMEKNIETITKKILNNSNNYWIYETLPQPIFVEKKYQIVDFELKENPDGQDKIIDFENSVKIYETFSHLPQHILCNERFWLWLELEKFYNYSKKNIDISDSTTIKNHWMHAQGTRRGLMFGVLSRSYFRIALTIDETLEDKHELSKWIISKPTRFREYSWRTYSSQRELLRGIIKGTKKAVEEVKDANEPATFYSEIAKYVSEIGSVKLLDVISEEDIEDIIYIRAKELLG